MKRVNENVAIVYIILGGMFATVLVATCRIKALFAEMNDRDIRVRRRMPWLFNLGPPWPIICLLTQRRQWMEFV